MQSAPWSHSSPLTLSGEIGNSCPSSSFSLSRAPRLAESRVWAQLRSLSRSCRITHASFFSVFAIVVLPFESQGGDLLRPFCGVCRTPPPAAQPVALGLLLEAGAWGRPAQPAPE